MNSASEAIQTLISAVNVAHNKGGVYSLEESHYIYLAISYLSSLQNNAKNQQEPASKQTSEAQQGYYEANPQQDLEANEHTPPTQQNQDY